MDSKVVEFFMKICFGWKYFPFDIILISVSSSFFLQGLIVSSRKDSLQQFKKPWAHEHEPVKDLLHAVKVSNPLSFCLCHWRFKCLLVPYYTLFTSLGDQANRLDWIIWSRKSIYKGGYWGHGILQWGTPLSFPYIRFQ